MEALAILPNLLASASNAPRLDLEFVLWNEPAAGKIRSFDLEIIRHERRN